MTATITANGQITIPLRLRKKLHLNVGDKIEFDENAPTLSALPACPFVPEGLPEISRW